MTGGLMVVSESEINALLGPKELVDKVGFYGIGKPVMDKFIAACKPIDRREFSDFDCYKAVCTYLMAQSWVSSPHVDDVKAMRAALEELNLPAVAQPSSVQEPENAPDDVIYAILEAIVPPKLPPLSMPLRAVWLNRAVRAYTIAAAHLTKTPQQPSDAK